MKRKLFLLICGIVAVSAFFAGCTARVDKGNDMSADDIVGMVGIKYDDFRRAMGNIEEDVNRSGSERYSYNRSIMGLDSNIVVAMDEDGEKVERVVVYTDTENLDKWRDVLGSKYGKSTTDRWHDGKTKVSIINSGKTGIITIEKYA